jgi:hypothetical protein
VNYNYEGVEADFTPADETILFELDTTMEDCPIESHPGIRLLIDRWAYDPETRRFPEFDDRVGSGGNPLPGDSAGDAAAKRSPLFGTESWVSVGTIFRMTYTVRTVPAAAYAGWGTIIDQPRGIEKLNWRKQPNRPWLRLCAKISRKGNACTIVEEAMLGKPGSIKAAKIIYSAAQLNSSSGDAPGSGLHGASLL